MWQDIGMGFAATLSFIAFVLAMLAILLWFRSRRRAKRPRPPSIRDGVDYSCQAVEEWSSDLEDFRDPSPTE